MSSSYFYKIMKKPYIRTIIGFSGSDCALIILFQLYGSKVGLFEGNFLKKN